ncbi:hypothetical protein ES703_25443 [subsurface metagenome]
MAIKSPTTYGDYYWAQQVEAQKFFADDSEKVIAPYFHSLIADIPDIDLLPVGTQKFISALSAPSSFAFLPFMAGVGINAIDESLDIAFEGMFTMLKREYRKRSKETWLTSAQVNTLWARQKIPEGLWDEVIASEGYEEVLGSSLYESQLPYPSIPDLVLYSRYHGDPNAPWGEFQKWFNISPRDWPVWKWLGLQRLTTIDAQALYKRGFMSEYDFNNEITRIGWHGEDIGAVQDLSYSLPNSMLLVQGNLMQERSRDDILTDISKGDIHPDYAQTYLDAVLTKPASRDIVAYELRKDFALTDLSNQLQKIGIHPDFAPVYKELAYQIPPVADIITMAVREAFTPDIAARFGQYEDFPKDLETWAGKKGLSKDWAARYWAAHWSLPSTQQGFEMLHRGVINQDELNMLLRALDVMPFWRDKLTQIAYRRLTRVDIRRMYKQGVLTEKEVYESYREHGYSDINAERMSEFTVKQTLATLSKFTSGDIIKAFTARMITESEAKSLLRSIGISGDDAQYIVSTAEYKRLWAFTDQQISGIRNLFKKRVYDENQARDKLARLNLPAEQIDVLMQQWHYEKVEELDATWTTAQTLTFLKRGLITPTRARKELNLNGYDDERIEIYMRNIEWTPPTS